MTYTGKWKDARKSNSVKRRIAKEGRQWLTTTSQSTTPIAGTESTREVALCVREFRRLTTAIPPARGNPDQMSDEELQDFYEFTSRGSDPEP